MSMTLFRVIPAGSGVIVVKTAVLGIVISRELSVLLFKNLLVDGEV